MRCPRPRRAVRVGVMGRAVLRAGLLLAISGVATGARGDVYNQWYWSSAHLTDDFITTNMRRVFGGQYSYCFDIVEGSSCLLQPNYTAEWFDASQIYAYAAMSRDDPAARDAMLASFNFMN